AGWSGSTHEARNLSCTTCHAVHKSASFTHQLVANSESQLCATCHRVQVAKTERAVAHMPVREGKMSCSSCHNPHGSISNVRALAVGSTINETCYTCHAEMRGPKLWEHAPVTQNCTTCHDPHGSSNDRMLVTKLPFLCQRCHIGSRHPSTMYDAKVVVAPCDPVTQTGCSSPSNRVYARSCVTCHAQIHGSNHPAGQFFLR
ncbi:MAG TPA: cytochrome c3 family protein, partial [Vicinamibacterales bacterium]|nr:cytochrome c3 family protein [Vicinamibacterales bacterium]